MFDIHTSGSGSSYTGMPCRYTWQTREINYEKIIRNEHSINIRRTQTCRKKKEKKKTYLVLIYESSDLKLVRR